MIAVSEPLAQYHVSGWIVFERHNIRTIINGVDTDLYSPCPDPGTVRREFGIEAMTPVLGSVGRLRRVKGYDLMGEVFRRFYPVRS